MAPKFLLHHRPCRSPMRHLGPNTFFRRVIVELGPGDNMPDKVPTPLRSPAPFPYARCTFPELCKVAPEFL